MDFLFLLYHTCQALSFITNDPGVFTKFRETNFTKFLKIEIAFKIQNLYEMTSFKTYSLASNMRWEAGINSSVVLRSSGNSIYKLTNSFNICSESSMWTFIFSFFCSKVQNLIFKIFDLRDVLVIKNPSWNSKILFTREKCFIFQVWK